MIESLREWTDLSLGRLREVCGRVSCCSCDGSSGFHIASQRLRLTTIDFSCLSNFLAAFVLLDWLQLGWACHNQLGIGCAER